MYLWLKITRAIVRDLLYFISPYYNWKDRASEKIEPLETSYFNSYTINYEF